MEKQMVPITIREVYVDFLLDRKRKYKKLANGCVGIWKEKEDQYVKYKNKEECAFLYKYLVGSE